MALILRSNPAPLSGALFVKNPRRRVRKNRKARRAIKFRSLGGLFKNRRRVKRVRRNSVALRHNRRRSAKKSGVIARLLARFKMKRNAGYQLNRRRRGVRRGAGLMARLRMNRRRRVSRLNPFKSFKAHGKTVKFFARKNRRHAKRNPGYLLNRRRRHVRKNPGYQLNRRRHAVRRNGGGFNLAILRPVEGLVAKFPILGSPIAKAMGYVAFGALAGATHYYGVKAVRYVGGLLPAPVQKVGSFLAPVGYSLTGVLANYAINKLPIPFLSDAQKRSLGIAAMIAGGVLDVFRLIKGQSSDLGDADDFGDGGAYDVVPLSGIGEGMGGIGQGMGAIGEGMGDAGDYGDAELADAYYSGPDLDGYEGEAAMYGAHAYRSTFGAPPKRASRVASPLSRHAGRRGHRWGWLIKAVGWERFQAIAAMEPEARCALIAELRKNAIASVDAKLGRKEMGAIGEGMGAIGQGLSGIGQGLAGFGMVASEGMGDLGFMSAGAAY